jgi:hypothetical protein
MIRYISQNNPYTGSECEQMDTTIDALTHKTPNGKTYSIYQSTLWKYYSPNTTANFCYEYLNDMVAVLNAWN